MLPGLARPRARGHGYGRRVGDGRGDGAEGAAGRRRSAGARVCAIGGTCGDMRVIAIVGKKLEVADLGSDRNRRARGW
jgi:hypothetical protein